MSKTTMELETILPEDLMEEILLHLPLKSLGQCKILSSHWNTKISHRRLIRTHLERYTKPNSTLLLSVKDSRAIILPGHNGEDSICRAAYQYLPRDRLNEWTNWRVVGTHHGLVCTSDYKTGDTRVWNPVTKQWRTIDFQHRSYDYSNNFFGFGFDTINGDHKVVRISSNTQLGANCVTIEICELRNTKTRVMPTVQVHFMLINVAPTTINGSSHWIAFNPKNKNLQIVSFDMDREKFVEIPFSNDMPNIYYDANIRGIGDLNLYGLALQGYDMDGKRFRLGVFKGSLCLFINYSLKVEIWLMNRDDNHIAWARILEIPKSPVLEDVVGFTANEELVIYRGNIYLAYDPWRAKTVHLLGCHSLIRQVVAYVESPVPVVPW